MDVSKDPIICKWLEGLEEYNRKRNFPIIEKGDVRNCHHFASVLVCKLSTFPSSSPKHIGILELNLTMMYIGWLCSLLLTEIQHGLLAYDVFWYTKNVLRKQMGIFGIFDYYIVEIVIGWSNISFDYLVPIEKQDGRNHSFKYRILWKN